MPLRACPALALGLAMVALLAEGVALAGAGWAPHRELLGPWVGCAAGGGLCFPLAFASAAGRRRLLALAAAAVVLGVLAACAGGWDAADVLAAAGWGPGLVAAAALAWRARRPGRPGSWLALRLLAAWAVLPLATAVKPFFTAQSATLMQGTVDARIARLDALTGTQPAALVAGVAERCPPLAALLTTAYLLLPAVLAAVAALEARRRPREACGLLPAVLLASVLVSPIYVLVPALGPAVWFGPGFAAVLDPNAPGAVGDVVHARSTVPSMHVAWALLCLLAARGLGRRMFGGTAMFAALTVLSTLALGEHYLLDLVVAVPFVLAVRGLCASERPGRARLTAVGAGALLVLAWCAAIRGDAGRWFDPAGGCAAMIGTIVFAAVLERRLGGSSLWEVDPVREKERQRFFFEKKNQKTFIC